MTLNVFRACAVVVLTAASGAAQEPPAKVEAKAIVVIGDTAAPPEWHLRVPVAINLAPDVELGRLSVRLVYPVKVLQYTTVRATDTLKRAGFEVTASKPKMDGETASVALDIKPAGKISKTLPAGTLAIVELKVDDDAPQKTWTLTAEDVQGWGLLPAAPAVKVASKGPAKFLVTPPGLPILSCFFYMH